MTPRTEFDAELRLLMLGKDIQLAVVEADLFITEKRPDLSSDEHRKLFKEAWNQTYPLRKRVVYATEARH